MDTERLEHPDKWVVETFGTTDLGGLRRTDRLVKMATAIAENPSASLPESMRNWADTLEDFEDPRGKYVCLLYVLREPLGPEANVEAGDDAFCVQWHSVENVRNLPSLAFNHIRLLLMTLRQFFTAYYHDAVRMQEIDACPCERESFPSLYCSNTAYWRYHGVAICPRDMQLMVKSNQIFRR